MNNINVLALAYLGDSVYEVYVRSFLINKGIVNVNELQNEAIKYVSANGQAKFLDMLLNENFLTEDEIDIVKRGRNHKSHKAPKNTAVSVYKNATGFETLIGYLYLDNNIKRIEEIIKYIESK